TALSRCNGRVTGLIVVDDSVAAELAAVEVDFVVGFGRAAAVFCLEARRMDARVIARGSTASVARDHVDRAGVAIVARCELNARSGHTGRHARVARLTRL